LLKKNYAGFHENLANVLVINIRSLADIQKDRKTDEGTTGLAIHIRITLREDDPK
jgi:hypothetical protein